MIAGLGIGITGSSAIDWRALIVTMRPPGKGAFGLPAPHPSVPFGICAAGSSAGGSPSPAGKTIPANWTSSGLRVLLVEDNPVNRLVATRMLSRLGLSPDTCNDGYQAVERAAGQTYDLILMDVQMPNMDGLEATHRIRALQRSTCGARIVALTASTTDETREACLAAGMDAFLGKPFTLEDLERIISSLFPARGVQ